MDIKGLVAVITGGASGIGETVARRLAAEGASIVLGDMNQEGLDRVVADIRKAGGKAAGTLLNVTDDASTAAFMDFAIAQFGSINIVAPCAGIIRDAMFVSPDKETGKVKRSMSTADFRAVIDVNLVGPFITMREACDVHHLVDPERRRRWPAQLLVHQGRNGAMAKDPRR